MLQKKTAIGIDLGGTRVKGVVIDNEGAMMAQEYTLIGQDNWKEMIVKTVDTLRNAVPGNHLIGISAPGIPDEHNTCIAYMPGRLEGLENLVWSEFFRQPAWVANDAIAALAAETKFGAAKGVRHAILLTLGTGVGGALLIDGKIYQGAFQKAGHAGHISVNHEGMPDITGMPGSLEDAIGNCSIEARSLGRYAFTHQLLEDYRKGNHFATWLWLSSVRKLAIAIAALTNVISPELVVIGGGIAEAGDDLFGPLEEFMALYEWRAGGQQARIIKARFGDLSGAIGAASFAMMKQETQNKI